MRPSRPGLDVLKSLAIGATMAIFGASAIAQGDMPSALPDCRQFAKLAVDEDPARIALFVIIDQTTPFSPALRQTVADQIAPLLKPGTDVMIYQFSAYMGGRYTQKVLGARMNAPIDATSRNAISKSALDRFDKCMAFQDSEIRKFAGTALRDAFGASSSSIGKSDVVASLRDVSEQVKKSSASRKLVLIASDMLENSAVSSFYTNGTVRKIDPAAELLRIESNKLLGDFGHADLFVIGAGLIEESVEKKTAYRDPKTMQALQNFWRQYFEKSNGRLVEFGAPSMLGQIR